MVTPFWNPLYATLPLHTWGHSGRHSVKGPCPLDARLWWRSTRVGRRWTCNTSINADAFLAQQDKSHFQARRPKALKYIHANGSKLDHGQCLVEMVGLLELPVETRKKGLCKQTGFLRPWSHSLRILLVTPFMAGGYDELHQPGRMSMGSTNQGACQWLSN